MRLAASLMAILIGGLVFAPTVNLHKNWLAAASTELYTFERQISSQGDADDQLYSAIGIDVDEEGNVYVATGSGARIKKFDSEGNFLSQFCVPRPPFSCDTLQAVAVDGNGNVYTGDGFDGGRVLKFSPTGELLLQFGRFSSGFNDFFYPAGIALDDSGDIFVSNVGGGEIVEFSPTGTFLSRFGSPGNSDNQIVGPFGISIDELNNIYIADSTNQKVKKFDASGNFLQKFCAVEQSLTVYCDTPRGVACRWDSTVSEDCAIQKEVSS